MQDVTLRQHILAALCMGFLVWVAFFAAYSGNSSREFQEVQRIDTEQRANKGAEAEETKTFGKAELLKSLRDKSPVRRFGDYGKDAKDINQIDDNGTEFWLAVGGFRLKFTDTLVALFTGLLSVATFFLWLSTRKLVLGAEKTARHQLRAYVFVLSAEVLIKSDEHSVPEAKVTFKNFGQTPAKGLISRSGFALYPFPNSEMPNIVIAEREFSGDLTKTDLAPTGENKSSIQITRDPAYATAARKAELVERLTNGTSIIFVYGEIRYTDVFGVDRWTKYRFTMGGPVGFHDGALIGCNEGNDYL